MITKVLFTMLVIVIVGMIFRSKNQKQAKRSVVSGSNGAQAETTSMAPKTVAYLLLGLLIIVSGVVFYFNWSDANRLVTLRVIDASGSLSEYQAYQKDIRGREFTSIGGVLIQLADTDRLEIVMQK